MPSLRNSLNIRSRVMWVRAFFNSYKRRVIAAGGVIQNEPCAVRSLNNNLLRSASWVLIPSGIEEDIVFAQKPTSGLGDLTFTRASDATYTDSIGVVRRSPYNLVTFSEQFDNAAWTTFTQGAGIAPVRTANFATAPDGTISADRIQCNQVNSGSPNRSAIAQNVSVTSGLVYTFSLYVKSNTGTNQNFSVQNASLNPNAGFSSQGIATNEWTRYIFQGTSATTGTNSIRIGIVDSVLSTSNDILIWGAQLVEGTSALDYFPTTNRQDVPRIDFRNEDGTLSSCGRLLLEPQRTNSIRNSSMVGAVAGSPGTSPTNWTLVPTTGLSSQILGIGVENGLPYIDYRVTGTASTSNPFRFIYEQSTQIAASNAQTWTISNWFKLTGSSVTVNMAIVQRNSVGGLLVETLSPISYTSSLQRYSFSSTNSNALTAFVVPEVRVSITSGTTYDFTIRIAAPQMELGAYATTWVPTTTTAVTRIADSASKTGVSSLIGQTEGTLFIDINYNQPTSDANGRLLQVYAGTETTNAILPLIFGSGANVNQFQLAVSSAGASTVAIVASAATLVPFGRQKFAIAYNAGVYTVYRNGSLFASATNVAPTSLSVIELGGSSSLARNLSNPINQAALFQTRLTNAQLAQLTTL